MPDCEKDFVKCIQWIEAQRRITPEEDIITDPANQYLMGSADGWNQVMDIGPVRPSRLRIRRHPRRRES